MNLSLLFISSGLFLGWSLGANDAANLFGTAVGTKVVKFKSAALIMSIFIIIGAVVSGSGASHTLGKLGEISSLPGAFIVALSSGVTVFFMTKYGLPVSTSQSIVGAIIGWNFFSKITTDFDVLSKILLTWVLCPLLAAAFSVIFYKLFKRLTKKMSLNIFLRYYYIRIGLILVGAFGAYALGANNIGNVMGVFTNAVDFEAIEVIGLSFNETQILFFLGGLAIAAGIFTYSKNVMNTIGKDIYKISPATALIVVLASSFVLFIFASESLESFLISINLPPIPLVPVSSSQAVVGAIIGIGIAKGDRNINFTRIKRIALGWLLTPVISLVLSYTLLVLMERLS
jgi:PiT family inorganic phosphate transporter